MAWSSRPSTRRRRRDRVTHLSKSTQVQESFGFDFAEDQAENTADGILGERRLKEEFIRSYKPTATVLEATAAAVAVATMATVLAATAATVATAAVESTAAAVNSSHSRPGVRSREP